MKCESEIALKELKVGETYSSRQLWFFINFNDIMILSEDVSQFFDNEQDKFKVIDYREHYVHFYEKTSVYVMPRKKKKVYIIEKV